MQATKSQTQKSVILAKIGLERRIRIGARLKFQWALPNKIDLSFGLRPVDWSGLRVLGIGFVLSVIVIISQ